MPSKNWFSVTKENKSFEICFKELNNFAKDRNVIFSGTQLKSSKRYKRRIDEWKSSGEMFLMKSCCRDTPFNLSFYCFDF